MRSLLSIAESGEKTTTTRLRHTLAVRVATSVDVAGIRRESLSARIRFPASLKCPSCGQRVFTPPSVRVEQGTIDRYVAERLVRGQVVKPRRV